jgi:hypothetical protein
LFRLFKPFDGNGCFYDVEEENEEKEDDEEEDDEDENDEDGNGDVEDE